MIKISKLWLECIGVWACRILIGIAFIVSAFTKGVDPWGTIFKLEQYFAVWGLQQPRSLLLVLTIVLCLVEFLIGISIFLGIYRRGAPRVGLLVIACFLILTGYIAIFSPVDNCGCFGDAIVLGNWATFWKNVLLTALMVILVIFNTRVKGLIGSMIQWLVLTFSIIYILIITITGYLIQPLVDFRPFAEGTTVFAKNDSPVRLIYEKDGTKEIFDIDALPSSSSGWKYVGREDIKAEENLLTVEDDDGEDVTEEIIPDEGDVLLIVTPEISRADISATMYLNRIAAKAQQKDIEVAGIIGGGNTDDIEKWKDLSMASYPVYRAEDTQLKELARGETSLVYIQNGIILQKISISIISNGLIKKLENGDIDLLTLVGFNEARWLKLINLSYIIVIVLLVFISIPGKLKKS